MATMKLGAGPLVADCSDTEAAAAAAPYIGNTKESSNMSNKHRVINDTQI
jgi:hypothetical protein